MRCVRARACLCKRPMIRNTIPWITRDMATWWAIQAKNRFGRLPILSAAFSGQFGHSPWPNCRRHRFRAIRPNCMTKFRGTHSRLSGVCRANSVQFHCYPIGMHFSRIQVNNPLSPCSPMRAIAYFQALRALGAHTHTRSAIINQSVSLSHVWFYSNLMLFGCEHAHNDHPRTHAQRKFRVFPIVQHY